MPEILPEYDILFLPLGFDKKSVRFTQLSMPTKTSEYMISGTPILVNAPHQVGLTHYAMHEKWGYLVTSEGIEDLKKAIIELYESRDLREKLGNKAREVAINKHDALVVREQFRFLLKQSC